MGRLGTTEREARIKRVWDLRKQGLSIRDIQVQLLNENYQVSVPQISFDIKEMNKREEIKTRILPFWCENKTAELYPQCCFNHKCGMPSEGLTKKAKKVPEIYDYQMELFTAVEEKKRLLMVKSRKIGATEIMKRAIAYYALYGFTKGFQTVIIPGTRADLSSRHIQEIRLLYERGGYEEMIDKDKSLQQYIKLTNGSEIMGFPSNPTASRGLQNVMLIFIDEGSSFDMRDDQQAEVLNACEGNLAVTNGNLTMISTPKGRRGIFYESYMDQSEHWYKLHIPYHRALGKLLSDEFIEKQKKSPQFDFQQEFMCQFSTVQNSVYSRVFLENSKGDYKLIEVSPNEWRIDRKIELERALGGLDIAVTKDFTAFVVLGKEKEGSWKCVLIKLYNPSHWPTILEDLARFYKEFNMENIGGDATALGKGFLDFVVAKQMNVENVVFSATEKGTMVNHNKHLFQTHELELPRSGCQELEIQFEEQMQTEINKITKFEHPPKRHDDLFWAFHLVSKLIGEHYEQVNMLL